MTQDTISFKCNKCGSKDFNIPADPQPDDMVSCAKCGVEIGRYADVQETLLKLAKEEVEKQLRDALKGAGFN